MSNDDWPDQTWENREAMVRKTLRPVSLEELKKLGEERFPIVTDPWCIRYQEFLAQHPDAEYFRAEIPGNVEVIYCRDSGKGVWFMPGRAMGIIQSKGLSMLAAISAKL